MRTTFQNKHSFSGRSPFTRFLAAAILASLLCSGPSIAQVRYTPREWQPKLENWVRDQDGNYVDDAIDALPPDDLVNVILDLNGCAEQEDLDRFALFGNIEYVGKYITAVFLSDVRAGDAAILASDDLVAGIEWDRPTEPLLRTSNLAMRVRTGFYFPYTIEDQYPNLDGTGVNIAILDTGVDDNHATFAGRYRFGYNAITEQEVNPVDDHPMGHGTRVAGIALGTGAPFLINQGIAPGAGLIDINVWDPGNGSLGHIFIALEKCIEKRTDWNIGVINISIGDSACTDSDGSDSTGVDCIAQCVNRAVQAGMVVTVAVGNSTAPGCPTSNRIILPGSADDAITVSAASYNLTVNRNNDEHWSGSLWGPRLDDGDTDSSDELKPDVSAYGVGIWTPIAGTTSDYGNAVEGTSLAAPHVAGLAALIIQANPAIRPLSVKELILRTAEERPTPSYITGYPDPGWDPGWGHGLVDAFAAIDKLVSGLPTDLGFVESCASPRPTRWLSADLYPLNPLIRDNDPNTIRAVVSNFGPNDAFDFKVRLGVYNFSNDDPAYHLCTETVPFLGVGQTIEIDCDWTPQIGGSTRTVHACLKAEIIFPNDSNFPNNCAQRNIDIRQAGGPAPLTEDEGGALPSGVPATFTMQIDNSTGEDVWVSLNTVINPPGADWDLSVSQPVFFMGALSCPVEISFEATPLIDGAGSLRVDVLVDAEGETGYFEMGGATLYAQAPFFTDCNGNDVDDWIDAQIGTADAEPPSLVHGEASATSTQPCSGFVDPRIESANGVDLDLGIDVVRLVFSEEVRDLNSGEGGLLTDAAFTVRETGPDVPPAILLTDQFVIGDKHYVSLQLDRPISLREWTTIEAAVEDLCGNAIEDLGDLGPGADEPDRVDIGFLPGDVDQNASVTPFDLLAFRLAVMNGQLPPAGCSQVEEDYLDTNRDGVVSPFDLLAFRQLVLGMPPSTQPWAGEIMNTPRP